MIFLDPKFSYRLLKQKQINQKYKELGLEVGLNVSMKTISFGDRVCVGSNTSLYETNLGDKVYIGPRVRLKNVTILDHSYVISDSKIVNSEIGKYCSIASNVQINLGNHPTNFVSTHPAFYSDKKPFETFSDMVYHNEFASIKIDNDVWIGINSIIMGGVKIGNGAIVGAGAIVTNDIEPYSIVGGVPAKHIKYRFEKEIIDFLLELKWWDKNENWLKENLRYFLDPQKMFEKFS